MFRQRVIISEIFEHFKIFYSRWKKVCSCKSTFKIVFSPHVVTIFSRWFFTYKMYFYQKTVLKRPRLLLLVYRYAHTGHVAVGHFADVGKRVAAVLLRVLHIRYHWRAALGGHSPATLFPKTTTERHVSQVRRTFSYLYFKFSDSSRRLYLHKHLLIYLIVIQTNCSNYLF